MRLSALEVDKMNRSIGFITLLMFIYNSILGYVIIKVTTSNGRLILLALIAIDYLIIFYTFKHLSEMMGSVVKPASRSARRR